MDGQIKTSKAGYVLSIAFDRPHKKNAITIDMYRELSAALKSAAMEDSVRVVLVSGAGGTFSSGNDLKDFLREPLTGEAHPVVEFLFALATFPKPIVAAVEGLAVGIGTTLLLHCDLVYATRNACFSLPFVRLGLVPEGGSSLLLPRATSPQLASELLLLGENFSAERALELGVVNELLEDGQALTDRANERAAQLSRLPPAAIRAAKDLIRRPTADDVLETIRREVVVFVERLTSPEAKEAMAAVLEKRSPKL